MRVFAASMALCGSIAWRASAFVGSSFYTKMAAKPRFAPPTCRTRGRLSMQASEVEDDTPQVYYASEVTEGNQKTRFTEQLGEQPLPENTQSQESEKYGPVDYDEYTDGDGFDGGDGQVGVVGDGSNAMETFDKSEVSNKKSKSWSAKERVKSTTMVKESKTRQRNAWGSSTGYAEKLKEEGMMDVNLAGEDTKKIRRQQFENWRNQQEVTNQQRARIAELDHLAGVTDEEGAPSWKKGKDGYFDSFKQTAKQKAEAIQSWNTYSAPVTSGKKDGTEWEESTLTGNEKVEATVQCVSVSGRPGHNTVEVKNTVMTFEPFHCSFVGDKEGFEVSPVEGTLARRGGEPTTLDVSYLGRGPADNRIGTLVVETEEDKWIFKVEGAMQ